MKPKSQAVRKYADRHNPPQIGSITETHLDSALTLPMGCNSTPCSGSSRERSHSSSWVSLEKSASTAPALVPVTISGDPVPGAQANAAVRVISRRRTMVGVRGLDRSKEIQKGNAAQMQDRGWKTVGEEVVQEGVALMSWPTWFQQHGGLVAFWPHVLAWNSVGHLHVIWIQLELRELHCSFTRRILRIIQDHKQDSIFGYSPF